MKKIIKRLTGQLTFFDYLSIVLGVSILLFIGLFFLRKLEWVEAEVKVAPDNIFWQGEKPPFWLADRIFVGEYELDGLGRKMAEVLDVRVFEREENRKAIYLKLRLRVVKNKRQQQYLFKGRFLALGSPIELKLSRVFLTGLVTYIEGVPDTRIWEEKIVEVRVTHFADIFPETVGMFPWRVEAIKIGDQMKDSQGRVVAEILAKKVKPAEKIVVTDDGKVLLREDPIKKDVVLLVKLMTIKQEGVNYFLDDLKVKVGSLIFLSLPEIDIWPEIIKIVK